MQKTFKTAAERLEYIVDKKFKTCFVFPIAQFEIMFGSLWGYGLEENELNADQKIMRKKWEEVRLQILNKGNVLRRSLLKELDLHEVKFVGYHTDFKVGAKK